MLISWKSNINNDDNIDVHHPQLLSGLHPGSQAKVPNFVVHLRHAGVRGSVILSGIKLILN